jgi:serine/threonine protein kinase
LHRLTGASPWHPLPPAPAPRPAENLLVSAAGELKISDFGCSRIAHTKSAVGRLSGTPAFTAPELVAGTSSDPFAADIWAMGACLYCFIYGHLPFQVGAVAQGPRAGTALQPGQRSSA